MSTVLHNGIIYQGEIGVISKCVNSRLNGQRAKRVCEMAEKLQGLIEISLQRSLFQTSIVIPSFITTRKTKLFWSISDDTLAPREFLLMCGHFGNVPKAARALNEAPIPWAAIKVRCFYSGLQYSTLCLDCV
jgi:hypothetical protein